MSESSSPHHPPLPYQAGPRLDQAVADPQLQAFVNQATLIKDTARKAIVLEAFGDKVDAWRTLGAAIKQHALDHLDYYLEQYIDQAQACGTRIHFAADAQQANAICLEIARENGCRRCVKSKSMLTEETGLLPVLEAAGIETIETDLGEFIIQLDHDAPSHIVTPMIHKDRTAVARAFVRELGAPYTQDPAQLTQIARAYLRDKFRRADLGISGANFLVASTGTLAICTNEGNGRLCTSVPRIHVAMVGIEKLVPDLDSLGVLLKLLARSSTAQPLTVYTHMVTGPRRGGEHDGAEQVHVILVDNGRTKVLQHETRDLLRCIRCGACLNACPVYRKIGGHAYGAVYSGPIGAVLTPLMHGLNNYPDLPQLSTLCGACYEACPVKIDLPGHLIRLRQRMVRERLASRRDRLFYRLWALSLRHPATYRLGGWLQQAFFRFQARCQGTLAKGDPYAARGWVGHAPGPVRAWTNQRDMPTPPRKSFQRWWRQQGDKS